MNTEIQYKLGLWGKVAQNQAASIILKQEARVFKLHILKKNAKQLSPTRKKKAKLRFSLTCNVPINSAWKTLRVSQKQKSLFHCDQSVSSY